MKQKLKFNIKTPYLTKLFLAVILGFAFSNVALAATNQTGKSAICLSCHNYDNNSPAQLMLNSKHGDVSNEHSPMAQNGCQTCHGESSKHTKAPTKISPDLSFGPHWTAEVTQQNAPCLQCHKDNTAQHWAGNTHAKNDLACVSCHDMHQVHDKVLVSAELQAEACTVCHKVQKKGIHTLKNKLADNPPCTQCHNPHANSLGMGTIVENRSLGCRHCHDLAVVTDADLVGPKAASYHKTMSQADRSCVDCHKSIAHAAADNMEPVIPKALTEQNVRLFFPAQSDLDWLLSEHPGSQAFRQGSNCQQCHRGDEESMGKTLAGKLENPTIDTRIKFQRKQNELLLSISWKGDRNDQDVALMWGASHYDKFARTGCWAACHSDMAGMSRDHNQEVGKYLALSRAQVQRIGQPPQIKSADELQTLLDNEQFVYMWRVSLNQGNSPKLESAKLLAKLEWETVNNGKVKATFQSGRWQVQLHLPLSIVNADENTFGIAVHGAGRSGAKHWVSLPQTFSLDGKEADFTAQ